MATLKYLFILITMLVTATSGCSPGNKGSVPSDLVLIMDISAAEGGLAQKVNILITADGRGHYEHYNIEGVIRSDTAGMVIHGAEQIVDTDKFQVSDAELTQLWRPMNDNNFFELEGDYRMAIGYSYAFIKVDANGQSHRVFNIGMEVPEIRVIVEAIKILVPTGVNIEYGEGFTPK
jgi:hypothetical protein